MSFAEPLALYAARRILGDHPALSRTGPSNPYGDGRVAALLLRELPDAPGAVPVLEKRVELLLVLQRVHRFPEALIVICDQLLPGDQSLEGLLHQVLALSDVIEDVPPKDKVSAVHPEVRARALLNPADAVRLVQLDEMER